MRIGASLPTNVERAAPSSSDVAATRTPVSQADLRSAIGRAYTKVNGRPPSNPALDMLTAQASLETGRGTQMYNYNFGGIKGTSPSGQTAHYMTREVENGQSIHLKQGFRAYKSLDDGAVDYVKTLQTRFGSAMPAAERGDVNGFAGALKSAGYYTAPESEYASALHALAPNLQNTSIGMSGSETLSFSMNSFTEQGSTTANLPTADAVSRVLDAVAMSSARLASPIDD
ncbi:MAG: glucosaminidase domain-containing protein [Polyangiaceae bacterium]